MFPQKKRVNKELFGKIIKTGATLSGSFFVFRFFNNSKMAQYAFVAPKSVARKAVARNKLRRRGYNALKLFPLKNSQGIFFYRKKSI